MSIDTHGHVPLKDEQYKLLMNNCFTAHEMGIMLSALGTTLRNLLNHNQKERLQLQINQCSACIGKLLLAVPIEYKQTILKMFKEQLNLEFNILEVQQLEKEQVQ